MEPEGDVGPDRRPASCELLLEQRRPGSQCAQEGLLLVEGDAREEIPITQEPRIGAAHDFGHDVDHARGDEALGAEALCHEYGPVSSELP